MNVKHKDKAAVSDSVYGIKDVKLSRLMFVNMTIKYNIVFFNL